MSLEQKVSSGALVESMATEAESLGFGTALVASLREATIEVSAPPTVTGEDGVPRMAEQTLSPTPVPDAKEESGIGMLVLIIVVAVSVVVAIGGLYKYNTAKPSAEDKLGGKYAGKKPVAMVVPTNDVVDSPSVRAPASDRAIESILGPPSWMGADEDSKEEENDLPDSGHLPDLPSLLPDLPNLDASPFDPPPALQSDFWVPPALDPGLDQYVPDTKDVQLSPTMEDDPDDPILGPASWMKTQ